VYLSGRSEGLGDLVFFGRHKDQSEEARVSTGLSAARLEAWSEQLLLASADLTNVLAELKSLPEYQHAESARKAGRHEDSGGASRRGD